MTIPQLLLLTAILNAWRRGLYLLARPEFLLRFVAWVLMRLLYRLKTRGIDNIPTQAARSSFASCELCRRLAVYRRLPRPIRFFMEAAIFRMR